MGQVVRKPIAKKEKKGNRNGIAKKKKTEAQGGRYHAHSTTTLPLTIVLSCTARTA